MYILKNEKNSAIEVLEKAIELNIVDVQIYKNLGKLYIMNNKLDEAIFLFNKLIEIDPKNKEGLMSLSQIYQIKDDFKKAYELLRTAASYYFDVKNSSTYAYCAMQAINIYNVLLKLDDKNPVLKINLANCYIKTSDYNLALPLLTELAKNNPQSMQIAQQLSLCHQSMGNLELAKDALKAVIHKKQENTDIFYNYAILLYQTGETSEAIEMFKKVIKMDSKNALAHKDLGIIYLNQHLINEANDEFQIALKLEPDNPIINFEYANYLSAMGDFISAKKLYNKAYEINNDNFEILKFMGINYIKLNDIENALLTLKKANDINSNDALVLYNLGNVYYTNKEYKKAKKMLEKAYLLNLNPETLNLLGIVNMKLNNFEEAKNYFEKLYQDYKNNPYLLLNLGKCYIKLTQNDKAREYLNKANDLLPDFEEVCELLKNLN